MTKIFLPNIGDLSEAQRISYFKLLYRGIGEELNNFINPCIAKILISDHLKHLLHCSYSIIPFYFYTNEIKIKSPSSFLNCLVEEDTYYVKIYVPYEAIVYFEEFIHPETEEKYSLTEYIEHNGKIITKTIIRGDFFICDLPFMTEEGTFFINGCERVVVSQMIRSPGIYFVKDYNHKQKATYTATIISTKGLWTRFFLDIRENKEKKNQKNQERKKKNQAIYLKLDEIKKIPELTLPEQQNQSLKNAIEAEIKNSDNYTIPSVICNKTELTQKKDEEENRVYISEFFNGIRDIDLVESINPKYKKELFQTKIKRVTKKNTDLEKSIALILESFFITNLEEIPSSIVRSKQLKRKKLEQILKLIKKRNFNKLVGSFVIGEIGRYRVNKRLGLNLPKTIKTLTGYDFIGIINGLFDLKYSQSSSDDIDHIKNKQIRTIGELLQLQFRIAFKRHSLFNVISTIPYKAVLHIYKKYGKIRIKRSPLIQINSLNIEKLIKKFFTTSQLSQFLDQTNPLAELYHKRKITVFGPNGLKRDHVSPKIRDIHPSHYGKICLITTSDGQAAGLIFTFSLYGRIHPLGWIETPYFILKDSEVLLEKKPVYLNPENESKSYIGVADISLTLKNKLEVNYLSVKDDYIFVKKNPNNVKFLTISPLQILSISTALIPFVEHNDATRALMGANMQRQAVPLLFPEKPIVGTGFETIAILDTTMVIKNFSQGKVVSSTSDFIEIIDNQGQKISYILRKYTRSNQGTYFNQRPIVWPGEEVFSGQIIADGPATIDGELSLGKNFLIAYMPWQGYNFEDAIIINERLVYENSLTSVHITEHETTVNDSYFSDAFSREIITRKLKTATKYIKRNLGKLGVIRKGSYVKEHDILVGKVISHNRETTPEENLAAAIFLESKDQFLEGKKVVFKDISLKLPYGCDGRVIAIKFFTSQSTPSFSGMIRISIAEIRNIQGGDKLAGRHGNKGVISKILSPKDMPYLPDGKQIDIILNPLGVPSRMNVGQVFECLLGFAGEKLGKRYKITPFDEMYGLEASRILINQKLKQASLHTDISWIYNESYPGKILLKDGRTGEYFDNPITVGRAYILKLIHMVKDKITARSTGPYSMITEQPLRGRSQKGGQRFGEMEVWALEAHGCSFNLYELFTIKSDDIEGRRDMYEALLQNTSRKKPTPTISEGFLTLIRELNCLGLSFERDKALKISPVVGIIGINSKEKQLTMDKRDLRKTSKLSELLVLSSPVDMNGEVGEKNEGNFKFVDIFDIIEVRLRIRTAIDSIKRELEREFGYQKNDYKNDKKKK